MINIIDLTPLEEDKLVKSVISAFDKFDDARSSQLDDLTALRNAIYKTGTKNRTKSEFMLPDVWELAQTLKSHLMENLYSNPEGMFDVSGSNLQSQSAANAQKAMLVNYFEKMNVADEIEKIVDSVVECGEATLVVGWQTKTKTIRRPKSLAEQISNPQDDAFILEEKVIFDGPQVRFIPAEDFVFDPQRVDSFDNAVKIYRTYSSISEIKANKLNNLLDERKIKELANLTLSKPLQVNFLEDNTPKSTKGDTLEILEYWGNITIDGCIYENMLVVVAGRKEIIRLEQNPFITQPFVHASIMRDPSTARGISPLKIALGISDIASTILNKQLDALSLIINPPYLAPKGCFKGNQEVTPGKIIEYDAALMPNQPIPLNFSSALQGWDFINFFKSSIESATGIFKTMAGNLASTSRTATEINYSASGQSARLNMLIDSISRKILIPMVEKTAEIIANFKIGEEEIMTQNDGKIEFIKISDVIRHGDYVYRYGDRKASIERKYRFKELFDIVSQFAQNSNFAKNINYVECFKFALEQYGVENPSSFLVADDGSTSDKKQAQQKSTEN